MTVIDDALAALIALRPRADVGVDKAPTVWPCARRAVLDHLRPLARKQLATTSDVATAKGHADTPFAAEAERVACGLSSD